MKFKVFQINLSNAQIDEINTAKERPAYYEKYLNTTFRPTAESIQVASDMYRLVAEIEAKSLGQVFDIGNIGPEEQIRRIAPMHSVSVGDIIVDETGRAKFVAPMGFESVNFQG